jgi:hypothetical protein
MTRSNPTKALNGILSGHICDRCNRRIRTGDLVRAYGVYYESDGWLVRRLMCDCGSRTIGLLTDGGDEVIVEAVYWSGRLVGVKTVDRSRP